VFLTRRSQKDHMRKKRPVTTPQAQSQSLIQDSQMTLIQRGSTTAFLFFLLLIVGSLPSAAQDVPRIEVFGGYSYLRFDSRSFGFAGSSNLNGYNLAPAFNIFHGFGVVGELSGQYGSHLNLRDVAVGPQILYPRNNLIFFAHVMYGDARTHVSVGNGPGDTARVIVAGAGADLHYSSRLSIRVVQVDYLRTSLFHGTQNNFRISTGLVYHWGEIHEKKHRMPGKAP
jgi:hypothetical protein